MNVVRRLLVCASGLMLCACTSQSSPAVRPAPAQSRTATTALGFSTLSARPLTLPNRSHCPASRVHRVDFNWPNGGIGGYALRGASVMPLLGDESVPLPRYHPKSDKPLIGRAVVRLVRSQAPPWLAVKTAWVSLPTYAAPYVVRGREVDRRGPIRIGSSPAQSIFRDAAGPDLNAGGGYRADPGYLWVRHPGCYGLQIDGTSLVRHLYLKLLAPSRG